MNKDSGFAPKNNFIPYCHNSACSILVYSYYILCILLQIENGLTDQHLLGLAEEITSESIRRKLGLALGLDSSVIQTIKYDNRYDIITAAYEMLRTWYLSIEDEYTAMEELVEALNKAKLKMLIKKVLRP